MLCRNVTAYLVYDDKLPLVEAAPVTNFNYFDDFALVPYDQQPLLAGTPDLSINLKLTFFEQGQSDKPDFPCCNHPSADPVLTQTNRTVPVSMTLPT